MGHIEDMLTVALLSFSAIPSRKLFECILFATVRDAGMSTSNRVFTHYMLGFLSMPISEVYALTPFIVRAYVLTCTATGFSIHAIPMHVNTFHALCSCTRLVHTTWQNRRINSSGEAEELIRSNWMQLRREAHCAHMKALQVLCTLDADLVHTLEDDEGNVLPTKDMNAAQLFAYKTIRSLAKANTHRLCEFNDELVWVWGHPVWTGELPLERTHTNVLSVYSCIRIIGKASLL